MSSTRHLANEPNCWDRSTFLKKHQIPSRSLKECFSGNPVKSPDYRAFNLFKPLPGCRAFIHSRFVHEVILQVRKLYFFPYDLVFYYDYFILSSVCILPLVCSLHFTLSLHFTPGLQSAVCSLQSAFYTDRFENLVQCSSNYRVHAQNYKTADNYRYRGHNNYAGI